MNFGIGEFFSLSSAATWAVGVILYRKLGETLPPLTLNFLKNSLVLGMVTAVLLVQYGLAFPHVPWQHVGIALLSGFIGIAVADTLYLKALNAVGASRMGIVGNLYSPFVILLSFLFLGERLGPMQWLGFALVMGGVSVIAWPARRPAPAQAELEVLTANVNADIAGGHALPAGEAQPRAAEANPVRGIVLGSIGIALMAVAIVMVKPTLEAQPVFVVTALRLVGALAGLVLISAARGELRGLKPPLASLDWPRLLVAAFVGQMLSMVAWLAGYKYTQASIAAILNETASVFILLLAWLWLKERPGRRAVVGVGLTLAGVGCMLMP